MVAMTPRLITIQAMGALYQIKALRPEEQDAPRETVPAVPLEALGDYEIIEL